MIAAAALLAVWVGDLSPLLARRFPDPALNYLLMDAASHEVLEGRWPRPDTPRGPAGSLVKPFLALAYGGAYPQFDCKGSKSGCWLARGHGPLDFPHALAQSCNAYFLNLARHVESQGLAAVSAEFAISAPTAETPGARIGLGRDWQISARGVNACLCGSCLAPRRSSGDADSRGACAGRAGRDRVGDRPRCARENRYRALHRARWRRRICHGARSGGIAAHRPTGTHARTYGSGGRKDCGSNARRHPDWTMMYSTLLACTLAATVRIGVFGLFHPTNLEVKPANGGVIVIQSGGRSEVLEGAQTNLRAAATVTGRGGAEASFVLAVPGKIQREYHGRLEIRPVDRGQVLAIVEMDRQTAVASVIAAELPGGEPPEAMKALAVVSRSFFAAAHGRHAAFDFCDTTHCQFLRAPARVGSAAAIAARETGDLVVTYQGRIVPALYSANCGGRTRSLAEAGWKIEEYPYFPVECPVRGAISGHRIGLCQMGAAEDGAQGRRVPRNSRALFPGGSSDRNIALNQAIWSHTYAAKSRRLENPIRS